MNYHHFMESKGSWLSSQHSLSWTICTLEFQVVSFQLVSPSKSCTKFFPPSHVPHTHPTQLITPVTFDKYKFHYATFSPICHFLPPRPKHLPPCHTLEYYHMFCIQYDWPSFTLIQTAHNITVLYISKFISFDGRWGHKRFWAEGCVVGHY